MARLHAIADSKRTKFQARLKNFQRLGFPKGLVTSQGRAALYSPGFALEIALALELTELGITPDRVVTILNNSVLPIATAMRQASATLHNFTRSTPRGQRPHYPFTAATTTYLILDPAALWPLTRDAEVSPDTWDVARLTLFCVRGTAIERELISLTSYSNRLSLVNVGNILLQLAVIFSELKGGDPVDWPVEFFAQVETDAAERSSLKSTTAAEGLVRRYLQFTSVSNADGMDPSFAGRVAKDMYLQTETVRAAIKKFAEGGDHE